MSLSILIDTGLFVLIWLIQLVVYPSFQYYSKSDLVKWHTAYTPRITFLVAPLMITQLYIAVTSASYTAFTFQTSYLALVLFTWLITFFVFIPIHSEIQTGNYDSHLLSKLVLWNWIRTIVWTIILVLSVYSHF